MRKRWVLYFWKAMFFRPARYRLDSTQSQQWNRGAYLARGLGHCGPCHTPRNLLLAERSAQALSGGAYSDTVAPGKIRTWSAVNLSLASTGLGHWSIEDIRRCLKTGHGPRAGMFGPMNNFIVNSLQYLSAEDALAIATYLKDLPPQRESAAHDLAAMSREAGEKVYADHGERCHLSSVRGAFLKPPPLAGSAVVQTASAASLINVILYGAEVPAGGPAPFGAWESMPAYADVLKTRRLPIWSTTSGCTSAIGVNQPRHAKSLNSARPPIGGIFGVRSSIARDGCCGIGAPKNLDSAGGAVDPAIVSAPQDS